MAEAIVSDMASEILKKIASLIAGELWLLCNLENDLKGLQGTMTTIRAVLLDAEKKQTQDHQLRDWLGKLRDVLFYAEDVLEEFELQTSRRQQGSSALKVCQCFSSCNLVKIGHKIEEIRERLDKIADDRLKFHLVESHVEVRHVIRRERETISFFQASVIIGREMDKEKIISFLLEPNQDNVSIIPIVGIGGLGKTTLCQMVFNDERVNRHFELKMWVRVSDDFNVSRLMKEIIYSVTHEDCAKLKANEIPMYLQQILARQKFLLVLDNVWNEQPDKLVELKNLLLNHVEGSKIIVTTRSKRVAEIMGTASPHLMQGLSLKNSLSLFKKWAFEDGEGKHFPNLIKIAEEIVGKCKGVPLAIRSLGSSLYATTNEEEWLRIKSDIWKLKQEEEDILPTLKLSYDYLPSHLKRCFAYLSLFSKDFKYDSDDVTRFWIAHGLLSNFNNGNEELEDVAMRCMKDLWLRCFIEDFDEDKNHLYYTFKMHDLFHDLAILVAKSECTMIQSKNQIVDESVRHFSFIGLDFEHQEPPKVLFNRSKMVRSIIVIEKCEHISVSIINTCLPKFKHLQLLSLRGMNFEVLPDSIGTLIHLRYLDLRFNKWLKTLPRSICHLQKLETFLFSGCLELKKLPHKIQKMISLRYMEITTKEQQLQENGIECLSSLRFLSLYLCENLVTFPERMQGLTGLRTLYIAYCPLTSLPYGIKDLKRLQKLCIHDCEKLNLKMEFRGDDNDKLRLAVRTFVIINLPSLVDLPQLILQGSANTLQCLKIERCLELVKLPEWLQNLTSLQTLEIIHCPSLPCLPEGMQRLTALRQLKIEGCPALSESCRLDDSKIARVPDVHLDE
ncbi:disease resistance protein RGA2-like [Mangifera indica]|uniref:disease resistance protein RGA2-like n=1 Tax=Mangifera indica TaxID=29780 RepID=UPI001CFBC0E7|nr:disease resistance protein RGA2-like [Mangifera indica]